MKVELNHHSPEAQAYIDADRRLEVHNAGFVRPVRFMGGDATIVQAARVSHGPGTKTLREDLGLLRYLIVNQHWSPFEQVELVYHVRLPIFIARQFVRHRTANLNEMSGRYTPLPNDFFLPYARRCEDDPGCYALPAQDTKNKQGSNGKVGVPAGVYRAWVEVQREAFVRYQEMLDAGVAREIARACLPVSTYTEWFFKMDLRNLLHFFALRCDSHAQQEAQDYANAMKGFARLVVPHTMAIVDELAQERAS